MKEAGENAHFPCRPHSEITRCYFPFRKLLYLIFIWVPGLAEQSAVFVCRCTDAMKMRIIEEHNRGIICLNWFISRLHWTECQDAVIVAEQAKYLNKTLPILFSLHYIQKLGSVTQGQHTGTNLFRKAY